MTTDESFAACWGTREIEIRQSNKNEANKPALLVALQVDSRLQIQISDGTATYQGDINPSDTKVFYLEDCDKVEILANHLLQEIDGISLVFDYVAPADEGIKVAIRQRLETGIVKMVWSGVLQQDAASETCYPFMQTLGSTIQQENKKCQSLQDECNLLRTSLQGWKDTAEKLSENTWQSEKDNLLQNFFELYSKTHDELRKTKLELQQLEDRQKAGGSDYNATRRRAATTTSRAATVAEQPDDQDELLYDCSTIDRLAAGPQRRTGTVMMKKATTTETVKKATAPKPKPVAPPTKKKRSEQNDQPSNVDPTLKEPVVTVGFQLGAIGGVSSAKELFLDPVLSKRKLRNENPDTKSISSISKKPKISGDVDEKRRKELEKMAAILGNDDDDDDDW